MNAHQRRGTMFAKDLRGRWHIATVTYPNSAETECGKELRCDYFAWHLDGPDSLSICTKEPRPERCEDCFSMRYP